MQERVENFKCLHCYYQLFYHFVTLCMSQVTFSPFHTAKMALAQSHRSKKSTYLKVLATRFSHSS